MSSTEPDLFDWRGEQPAQQARMIFDAEIMPLFEAHRSTWLAEARAVARHLGRDGGLVTVNDVRRICPPPVGADPRVMGAVFTRSEWRNMGAENSDRRTCHGRPISVFRLRVAEVDL